MPIGKDLINKSVNAAKSQLIQKNDSKNKVFSPQKKHSFDAVPQSPQESKARIATSYQLVYVKENDDGSYSLYDQENKGAEVQFTKTEYPYLYRASLGSGDNKSVFEFPITPQLMNITTPYAIESLASSNGVVEEHAGVYFKMIQLAGTFGINPARKGYSDKAKSGAANDSAFGLLSSLFSNTFNRSKELISQFNRFTQSLPFGLGSKSTGQSNPNNTPVKDKGTGYQYALSLDRFLEDYAIKKSKSGEYKKLKLALHLPKFGYAYLVTPVQYTYNQSVESPLEYRFNLQLKAYKRIALKSKSVTNPLNKITQRELNDLQKIFVSLNRARMTLSLAYDVVKAVRTDVLAPFEALRQAIVIVKGALSLPFTVADIYASVENVINFINKNDIPELNDVLKKYENLFSKGGAQSTFSSSPSQFGPTNLAEKGGSTNTNEVTEESDTNQEEDGSSDIESPHQINEVLDGVDLEEYDAAETELNNFAEELEELADTTSDTVGEWIEALEGTASLLADYFGAGDETVSQIYQTAPPSKRLQPMNIDEMLLLSDLYEAITALYLLKSSGLIVKNDNKAFEVVSALTEGTPYEFGSTKETLAIKVPVPYGLTIEQIAQKYLKDYTRWVEIATLNNLNSPYIDEEGFFRPFLSNGSGRRFNVSDASNLYVGQTIFLQSTVVPKQARKIIAIDKLSDTDYLITVDGLDNLDTFQTVHDAKLHAFLPHTTNSTQTIWIPTENTSDEISVFSPPAVAKLDEYSGVSKVDWALGDDGDIAIDNFGDIKLSYGLKNLYQSLRLKIISPQGSRLVDQDYGMGIVPGINLSELSVEDIVKRFNSMIIADERYSDVKSIEIDLRGPQMKINAIVGLRNGLGSVPISVAINDL